MIAVWVVVVVVWLLLSVIVGLGVAQVIRRRDAQAPAPEDSRVVPDL